MKQKATYLVSLNCHIDCVTGHLTLSGRPANGDDDLRFSTVFNEHFLRRVDAGEIGSFHASCGSISRTFWVSTKIRMICRQALGMIGEYDESQEHSTKMKPAVYADKHHLLDLTARERAIH